MDEIKFQIANWVKLLPTGRSVTQEEAEYRSSEFLIASACLAGWRHNLTDNRIKFSSVQAAIYASELYKCSGKTITENKITVEASETYAKAREDFEYTENDINYVKMFYDIFNNAHIFYRNLAKQENS